MSEQSDISKYRLFLLNSHRDYVNSYNQLAEKFIKNHFVLNAGAASVLAIYFLQHGQKDTYLQYAVFIFVLGTLFSIWAILLDFFWGYFSLRNFQDNFFDNEVKELIDVVASYESYQSLNKKNLRYTVILRIFNGLLAYICFLVGLFFIVLNKSNIGLNLCPWATFIVLYGISSVFLIWYWISAPKE